jgi:hypothetical protein
MSWQQAFLVVSALLGEPADVAAAALDDASGQNVDPAVAATHATWLASLSRAARADALARAVATLVAEIERASFA